MDKLQELLAKKEAESPSPSLRERGRFSGLAERIFRARNKFRKVEKVSDAYVPLELNQELVWNTGELRNPSRRQDSYDTGEILPTKELVNLAKVSRDRPNKRGYSPSFGTVVTNKLVEAHDRKKSNWKEKGYDWDVDGKLLDKLKEIRKNTIKDSMAKIREDIYDGVSKGRTGAYQLENFLNDGERATQELRFLGEESTFDTDGEVADFASYFNANAVKVPVEEFLLNNNRARIVHGVPYFHFNTTENNRVTRDELRNFLWNADGKLIVENARRAWKEFLDAATTGRLTLSCSVVNEHTKIRNTYHPVGILVDQGDVYDVSSVGDGATVAFAKDLRLPYGHLPKSEEDIRHSLDIAARLVPENSNRNEVVVGNPRVSGLYFSDRFRQRCVSQEDIDYLHDKARKLGVPLYRFTDEKGFEVFEREGALVA